MFHQVRLIRDRKCHVYSFYIACIQQNQYISGSRYAMVLAAAVHAAAVRARDTDVAAAQSPLRGARDGACASAAGGCRRIVRAGRLDLSDYRRTLQNARHAPALFFFFLRPSEMLYVQLPEREEDNRGEAGAAPRVIANRRAAQLHSAEQHLAQRELAERDSAEQHSEEQHSAEQHSAEPHSAEQDLAELDSAQQTRRRHIAAWTPLRVVAHHSYVAGMRVSGIMHRDIVRLEFDRK
jgi:hypothetical protein